MDTGAIFDSFVTASTFSKIQQTFQQLCIALDIDFTDGKRVYPSLRSRLKDWKAEKLFKQLDKRFEQVEYRKQTATENLNALVIGCGPCGLRSAIELALLGSNVVVVEQREKFSRNNVLHLWEFVIHDLKSLGAKIFYPKFCTGSIEHISIRQLQCLLLKVALCFGVQVHEGVSFLSSIYPEETPSGNVRGFRASLDPPGHLLSDYEFDILIGADGKRNTVSGFSRDEMRGKLAIAITANFVNNRTAAEERVPEISGVAYIFNQAFFKEMYAKTGVDLENIVYYKDETHYFVMCAKKQSLLEMGVIKEDFDDVKRLLDNSNVDMEALEAYARAAADFATNGKLPALEFAKNHHGIEDISMFDFTSLYSAKHSVRLLERKQRRLLMGIVGDSLHEPFWPTGSGCARGFLGVFDTAWLIREYGMNQRPILEMVADRESIYRLLAQVTKDNMHKALAKYTIDPKTRYVSPDMSVRAQDIAGLFSTDDQNSPVLNGSLSCHHRRETDYLFRSKYAVWRFCQCVALGSKLWVYDLDVCWRDGRALASLISRLRPGTLDYDKVESMEAAERLEMIFEVVSSSLQIKRPCSPSHWPSLSADQKFEYIKTVAETLRSNQANVCEYLTSSRSQSLKRKLPMKPIQATRRKTQPIELLAQNLLGCSSFTNVVKDVAVRPPIRIMDATNKNEKQAGSQTAKVFLEEKVKVVVESPKPKYNHAELTNMQRRLIQAGLHMPLEDGKTPTAPDKAPQVNDGKLKNSVDSSFKQAEMKAPSHTANVLPILQPSKRNSVPLLDTVNRQVCQLCNEVVYAMERMQVESMCIHKHCFRCTYCNQPLRLGEYGKDKDLDYHHPNKFFCNTHLRVPLREKIAKIERSLRRAGVRETATVAPLSSVPRTSQPVTVASGQDHHVTLNFFSPEQLRDSTTNKIRSSAAGGAEAELLTPERAEFGSHLTVRSKASPSGSRELLHATSSDSDEEDYHTCRSDDNKDENDSISDYEDLGEEEIAALETTILEIADENPDTKITDDFAKGVIERVNQRRMEMETPKRQGTNVEEQFYTPAWRPQDTSGSEHGHIQASKLPATSEIDVIRMRKKAELEEMRSTSRARARSKTDAELGIAGDRLSFVEPSESKPRASSLLLETPRSSKLTETDVLTVATDGFTDNEQKKSPKLFSRLFSPSPDLTRKKASPSSVVVNAEKVHSESRKETNILTHAFRKMRLRRGEALMSPTKEPERTAAVASKAVEPPIVAVAPSPRITDLPSSSTSPLPTNDKFIQHVKKKSEKLIKHRDDEESRHGQEIERNIQEMEVRMSKICRDGEQHEKKLTLDPTNRMELECWMALVHERDMLADAIELAKKQLHKLQLQYRFRELTRQMHDIGRDGSDRIADPKVAQELLTVVLEQQKLGALPPVKLHKFLTADSVLREKNYDFRNMERVFAEADA